MKKWSVLIFLLFTSQLNAAVVTVVGKIENIKIFTNNHERYDSGDRGMALIHLERLPPSCGDVNYRRVAIGDDHPLFDAFLSIALTAKATDALVRLAYIDQCTLRGNAWDFSYLELMSQP